MKTFANLLGSAALLGASMAHAGELEVTHWWTSGGEAAAVAEFAKAFDATGNTWVDGAIAGSGGTARRYDPHERVSARSRASHPRDLR